jgi:hypothetical protein
MSTGYHPWKGIDNTVESRNKATSNFFEKIKKVRDEAKAALEKTQKTIKKYYDAKRCNAPVFTAIGSTEGMSGNFLFWDVFREFPISQWVLTRFT